MNDYVWFDQSLVCDQLINNIKLDDKDNMIFTTFMFCNIEYGIIFLGNLLNNAYDLSTNEECLQHFKNNLSVQDQHLLLEYISNNGEIQYLFKEKIPDNIFSLMAIEK